MIKICITVILLVQVIRVTYGSDLVSDLFDAVPIAGDIAAGVAYLSKDFNTIYIPPLNNIGTVAVPINLLCSVPGLNKYVTCFVCHLDCVYSHNTYGGTCEKDENDAFTCLCARTEEEAKRRKIFPSSKETCQAFSALNPVWDIEEIALSKALEARTSLLLCPGSDENYETSGCSTDCSKNHDAKKGVDCKVTPSIYGNNEERLHCNCL